MSSNYEYKWCSWCHRMANHVLIEKNYLTRNEYRCDLCNNYSVQCRYCDNMATYKPYASEQDGFFKSIKENWASELCAEHDGSISSFENLSSTFGVVSKVAEKEIYRE